MTKLRLYKVKREDIFVTCGERPYTIQKPEYLYWPKMQKAWLITETRLIEADYKELRTQKNKKLLRNKKSLDYTVRLLKQYIQSKEN